MAPSVKIVIYSVLMKKYERSDCTSARVGQDGIMSSEFGAYTRAQRRVALAIYQKTLPEKAPKQRHMIQNHFYPLALSLISFNSEGVTHA